MRTALIALALFVTGCGSTDTATPPATHDAGADTLTDPLIGTWYAEPSPGAGIGAQFDGTNFALDYVTSLTDGTTVLEIIKGTYTVSGNTIMMRLTGSSCQGVESPASNAKAMTFSRSGTALNLNTGTTLIVMQPATSSTGTGVAKIGCIKSDNTFVVNPVTPVP